MTRRFIVPKEKDDEFYWNIIDTQTGKVVLQHISLVQTRELCDLMNSLNVKSRQFEKMYKRGKIN